MAAGVAGGLVFHRCLCRVNQSGRLQFGDELARRQADRRPPQLPSCRALALKLQAFGPAAAVFTE
jgi:hypothetical protein